jgi:hypothetical protein
MQYEFHARYSSPWSVAPPETQKEDKIMIRRIILPGVVALVLAGTGLAAAAGTTQTKHAGAYGITLMVEGPMTVHMMGTAGKTGESMVGGKNPTCFFKGSLGPSRGAACNHHIEVHVVKNGTTDIHATVAITLTNTKTHAVTKLPIMMMYGKDVRDYHYGNNVHEPAGTYRVSVKADTARVQFAVKL